MAGGRPEERGGGVNDLFMRLFKTSQTVKGAFDRAAYFFILNILPITRVVQVYWLFQIKTGCRVLLLQDRGYHGIRNHYQHPSEIDSSHKVKTRDCKKCCNRVVSF